MTSQTGTKDDKILVRVKKDVAAGLILTPAAG
jgi:hypothetical protein